jgi:hypothetical protein
MVIGILAAVFLLSPVWVAVLLLIYIFIDFVKTRPWEHTDFEEYNEDEAFTELED